MNEQSVEGPREASHAISASAPTPLLWGNGQKEMLTSPFQELQGCPAHTLASCRQQPPCLCRGLALRFWGAAVFGNTPA